MEQKGKLFYGWWIVLASFFLMFAGIGILVNCTGVFFSAVIQDLGFSRAGFGLYFTIAMLGAMAGSPILGKLIVKYNSQLIISICLIVAGLSFAAYSLCTQLWHFYIVAVLAGVFGAGTSTLPASILLTNWFVDKRGTAMGIAFTGSGIGGMVMNPLAQWIITNYSWQTAYVTLGVIFLVVTLPFALFVIKLHPGLMGMKPLGDTGDAVQGQPLFGLTLVEGMKSAVFWVLGISFFMITLIQVGLQNNIPIFLQDLGHTATFAATVMAIYMGLLVLGKMLLGSILDKFGPRIGITFCVLLFIVACFAFAGAKPLIIVAIFAVAFGLAAPIATVMPSYMIGHMFGNLDYGTIYGIMNIFITLGMAAAMPIAGVVFDKTGSMVPTWYIFMGIAVLILLAFYYLLARQPKFKELWHS